MSSFNASLKHWTYFSKQKDCRWIIKQNNLLNFFYDFIFSFWQILLNQPFCSWKLSYSLQFYYIFRYLWFLSHFYKQRHRKLSTYSYFRERKSSVLELSHLLARSQKNHNNIFSQLNYFTKRAIACLNSGKTDALC